MAAANLASFFEDVEAIMAELRRWSASSGACTGRTRLKQQPGGVRVQSSLRRVLLFDGPIAPARRWIEDYYDGELAELLVWIVSTWSVATSTSRVLLGRHFVLDVIAGAFLGILEALLVLNFLHL